MVNIGGGLGNCGECGGLLVTDFPRRSTRQPMASDGNAMAGFCNFGVVPDVCAEVGSQMDGKPETHKN